MPYSLNYRRLLNGRITCNPSQWGGRPCIRGIRIREKVVHDLLPAGVPQKKILEDYSYLESEDIADCLEYAAAIANRSALVAQ